ncbi:MAG: DUF4407 domain-containing protein [Balneola sp.]
MKRFTCFILGKDLTAFITLTKKERRPYYNMVLAWILVSLMGSLTGAHIAHNFTNDIEVIVLAASGTTLLIGFLDYLILSSDAKGFQGVLSGIFRVLLAILITFASAISTIGLLFHKDIENKSSRNKLEVIQSIEQTFETKRDSLYADVRIIKDEIQGYHATVCIPESHRNGIGPIYKRKHEQCITRQSDVDLLMPQKISHENQLRKSADLRINEVKMSSAGISERYSSLFVMMQNDDVKKWSTIIIFGIILLIDLLVLLQKTSIDKKRYEQAERDLNEKFRGLIEDEIISKAEGEIKIQNSRQKIEQVQEHIKTYREALKVVDESFKDLKGAASFFEDLEKVKKKYPEIAPLVRQNINVVRQAEQSLIQGISELEMIYPDLSSVNDVLHQTGSADVANDSFSRDKSKDEVDLDKVPISKTDLYYVSLGMKGVIAELWKKSKSNQFDYAKAVYEWICEHIRYNYEHSHDFQMTARDVYNAKIGQCLEMGILFVAMMRYKNVESKPVYVDVDNKGKKVSHGCAQVTLFGQSILVDPAYNAWNIKHKDFRAISDDELHEHMIYWNA